MENNSLLIENGILPYGFVMTKKNPVYLTVLLVALAMIITFQLTIVLTESYKIADSTQSAVSDFSEQLI
jgi:hypothetical protein